jgi:SHS family lactate transporter-like MFS transporter
MASPVPVVDAEIGRHYPLPSKVQDGAIVQVFDYSIGMAIFMACAFVYLIIVVLLGTENRRNGISDDEQVADEEEAGFDVTSPVMAHGKW